MSDPRAPVENAAVFLTGYRASGKSSVARSLARSLGWSCVDTDRLVETAAGVSIAKIFQEQGEPAFRDLESASLRDVCSRIRRGERLVVATGGGLVLREENRSLLREHGTVVFLSARPETLRARLAADVRSAVDRPSLTGRTTLDELATVLAARLSTYRESADHEVSTDDLEVEEIRRRVAAVCGLAVRD